MQPQMERASKVPGEKCRFGKCRFAWPRHRGLPHACGQHPVQSQTGGACSSRAKCIKLRPYVVSWKAVAGLETGAAQFAAPPHVEHMWHG